VAVAPMEIADREERLGALRQGLADPDEDAGGERDRQAPGVLDHAETDGGDLVRRSEMRAAALGQPVRGGLEHHPHRRRDLLQARHLLVGHDAGVEVREQARLLYHADGCGPDVLERRAIPAFGEPVARHRVALLRAVAEREQRLLAPEPPAGLGDRHDLLRGKERPFEPGRRLGERAVVAVVPAQHRERDEDLARVGDGAAVSELA